MRAVERGRFYLTTLPGLESVTHLELCEKWGRAADFLKIEPYPDVTFYRGGMEFEAPLSLGLSLNQTLRTATRVLLRVASFEAPNEKAFKQVISEIDWSQYFAAGSHFEVKFTSKSSKLSMSKQIVELLTQSMKKYKVKYKKGGASVFVRLFRDHCQISFDTTGEAAFKRGEVQKGSIASLRGTTAQALLRLLVQGAREPVNLIDPMCGAGTFLLEALSWGQLLDREFAFQNTYYGEKAKTDIEEINSMSQSKETPFAKVWGRELNEKAVALAKKNLAGFDQEKWNVEQQDLFKGSTIEGIDKPFVIVNPPWGKRLPGARQDFLKAIEDKFQPQRLGILVPAKWRLNPISLEKVRDIPVLASGVETRFIIYSR